MIPTSTPLSRMLALLGLLTLNCPLPTSEAAEAQITSLWDKTYGGTGGDILERIVTDPAGGYLLAGHSSSQADGNKLSVSFGGTADAWIVKVDSRGDKLWDAAYGGSGYDFFRAGERTSDGGYILVGSSASVISGNKSAPFYGPGDAFGDIWVVKVDANGLQQWDQTLGGSDRDEGFYVHQSLDGGYVVGGFSRSGVSGNKGIPNFGYSNFWLINLDASGNKVWEKVFGNGTEELAAMTVTSDGGYVLAGHSRGTGGGNKTAIGLGDESNDVWIVRTDADGNKLWDQSYGGNSGEGALGITQTTDGGFLIGAYSSSAAGSGNKTAPLYGATDFWAIRIDPIGNVLWDQSFGGTQSEYIYDVIQTPDGGFLLAGISNSDTSGNKTTGWFGAGFGIADAFDIWVVKVDANGVKQGEQVFGGRYSEEMHDIVQATDGGYLLGGASWSGIDGSKTAPQRGTDGRTADMWLVKISATATPLGAPDAYQTAEDTTLSVSAPGVLANDSDPDGDSLEAILESPPSHGTLTLNSNGSFNYTPSPNYSGPDSFSYKASDGQLSSASVTVSIDVIAVNDAPTLTTVSTLSGASEDTDFPIDHATLLAAADETDVEGDTVSFRVEGVSSGSLSKGGVPVAPGNTLIGPGERVVWRPPLDANGTLEAFTVRAWDGALASASAVPVSVAVAAVNDAPVAVDDTASTLEDTTLVIATATLLANDIDVDGPALSVTAVENAQNGTVSLAGGSITFTPNLNFNGTASFEYTVSDGSLSDVGLVTVSVSAVNDAPVAVDDTGGTPEDTTLVIAAATLLANDTDVDGPALSVTAVGNAQNGTVSLAGGNVTFTPNLNFNGTASFEYTVSDGSLSDTGLVTITITAVNDSPVAVDDTASTPEDTPLVIAAATLLANDTDVDGPALSVTAVGNPQNGTVSLAGGNITFTPNLNFNGTASFEYIVSDGSLSDVGLVTVTITAVNDPPVAVDDTASTLEDTPLVIAAATLLANDTDVDGPALSVTSVGNAQNGTASLAGGNVTFTPNLSFNGTASFEYIVSDGSLSDTGLVTITITAVNDPPVAVDDTASTPEDTPLVIATATLLANDTDVDGPALSVTAVGNAQNGTVSLAGGNVTFTPNLNFNGAASFEYTVSDGSLSDVGFVTVNVSAVNDPPVAVDDPASTPEDTPLVIATATLLANDTDVDGPALSVSAVGNAQNGTVSLAGGNITFRPNLNFNGTASFEYTVSDGSLSDAGLVTITITAVNNAPTLAAINDPAPINEDAGVQALSLSGIGSGAGNETQSLTVTASSSNTALIPDPTVNYTSPNTTGSLSYTPIANANGTATITVTVTDDGTAGGPARSVSRSFTVTVNAVNDPPVAVDDTASTLEDTPLVIAAGTLLANDTDVDGPALSVTAVGNAQNGTVSLAGGNITFTPNLNLNGTASFEYTASDGSLGDVGLVTITITAVNDSPVAVDDTASTPEDTTLVIAAATLLANDTDVDGPTLSVTAVGNAQNGTASLAGGNITFRPNLNFNGAASFEYTVSDGSLGDVGLVTITITAVNDSPVAVDDTASTPEDTPLVIAAGTLLANDIDVDGPALSVTAVGNAQNGTVSLAGGNITFRPNLNFNGTASFEYTASDGSLSDAGLVTITITAVNDAPTLAAIGDPTPINEDAAAQTVGLSGIGSGAANETQSLTVTASSSNPGLIPDPALSYTSPNPTGNLSYTPIANASGTATITVTVTDDGTAGGPALSVSRSFTVTVNALNDTPTLAAISDPAPINEDAATQTVGLSGIGSGAGNETQTLMVTASSSNTALIPDPAVNYSSPNATGSLSYTPLANANGAATVTVTVTDDDTAGGPALSVSRSFTVVVNAVNDAPTLSAISDPAPINEDAGIQTVNLSGISSGAANEMQGLTVTASSSNPALIPDPAVNYSSPNATGSLSYTPAANANGTVTITVTVTDDGRAGAPALSVSRSFAVEVSEVNDAPTAVADNKSTAEDLVLSFPATNLLFNDQKGPANESGQTLSVTSVSATLNTHGTVSLKDGIITYAPAGDYNGPAAFDYTLEDDGTTNGNPDHKSATGTVNVTVDAVNDPPEPIITSIVEAGVRVIGPNDFILAGLEIELTGTFADVDNTTGHTATIDWGDGVTNYLGPVNQSLPIRANHTYTTTGSETNYTVRLIVVDEQHATGEAPREITVVGGLQALEAVADILTDLLTEGGFSAQAEKALRNALEKLIGQNGGNANNGALDQLELGNLEAALVKTRQAIADLQKAQTADPTLDLVALQRLLALSAESIINRAILTAQSVASSGENDPSIVEAKTLVSQGQLLIQGDNFLGAVDKFLEALTKIKPLLQGIQKASMTSNVGLNIQRQFSGAATDVEIILRGLPGSAVEIEFSPNLTEWGSFRNITLDANGHGILRIPDAKGSVQGFYRIQRRGVELK